MLKIPKTVWNNNKIQQFVKSSEIMSKNANRCEKLHNVVEKKKKKKI